MEEVLSCSLEALDVDRWIVVKLFNRLRHSFCKAIALWISWTAGDVCEAISCCKLSHFMRRVLRTIVTTQNLWNAMSGKDCFQSINDVARCSGRQLYQLWICRKKSSKSDPITWKG